MPASMSPRRARFAHHNLGPARFHLLSFWPTKGAPEGVLQVSSEYEIQGSRHPLEDAQRKHCDETYRELSAKGFRVLAVAYRPLVTKDICTQLELLKLTAKG
jgi:Mg2+-importing ATPase